MDTNIEQTPQRLLPLPRYSRRPPLEKMRVAMSRKEKGRNPKFNRPHPNLENVLVHLSPLKHLSAFNPLEARNIPRVNALQFHAIYSHST